MARKSLDLEASREIISWTRCLLAPLVPPWQSLLGLLSGDMSTWLKKWREGVVAVFKDPPVLVEERSTGHALRELQSCTWKLKPQSFLGQGWASLVLNFPRGKE